MLAPARNVLMILLHLLLLLGQTDTSALIAEQDGVRVRVDVQSNLYTWTIENLSADRVNRFAIYVHHSHAHQGPAGWAIDGPIPSGVFRAWPQDETEGLRIGQQGQFSVRFTSFGAMLGLQTLTLGLQNGRVLEIPNVWAPAPESQRSVAVAGGVLAALALLHTGITRRLRRSPHPQSADSGF